MSNMANRAPAPAAFQLFRITSNIFFSFSKT